MTLAIAIWGAVLGTLSIALQFALARRDRPELAVRGQAVVGGGGLYAIQIDVANRGKRATTLVEALLFQSIVR